MKKLSTRLFLMFFLFMVFFTLSSIGLNEMMLEKYYIYKNKDVLIAAEAYISDIWVNDNTSNGMSLIDEFDRDKGISIMVSDRENKVIYSSFFKVDKRNTVQLPNELNDLMAALEGNSELESVYGTVYQNNEENGYIVLMSKMPKSETLVIRKSIKSIRENITFANEFFTFSGVFLLLLGSVFIFFYSKKLTKPIAEMSDVAVSISKMDFSKRVPVVSKDEVGSLSNSINVMANRLDESVSQLQEDLVKRKQLIRDISHELKTPIGVIKAYSEALKFGYASDSDQYHTVIVDECDRMDKMIKELLSLSTLEAESAQLIVEDIELGAFLEEMKMRFNEQIRSKKIDLVVAYESDMIIKADKELCERAVSNLITNALRHTPIEGRIEIVASSRESQAEISVYNSGSHIDEQLLEKIWDVFYKVDQSRKRESGGQGIGLSIVKTIVKRHGGDYGVINIDDGVRFFISLPKISF